MANIKIAGDAVVLTSTLKLEDLKTIAQFKPKALTLMSEEGKEKEPLFKLAVAEKEGALSPFGATFVKSNPDGFATMTFLENPGAKSIKDVIFEKYGTQINHLNKLESTLCSVVEEIAAEKAALIESITEI